MNLDIRVRPLAGGRLVQDYLRGAPELAPFYAGHPTDPDAYRRKAAAVRDRLAPADRAWLPEALRPTSAAAADRLAAIAEGNGFFVTTGQQPGFMTGPLYTLHKMLSAVSLAAALEEVLGVVVAPLFWVASDDHDWHEVHRTYLLDRDNALQELALSGEGDLTMSMGRRALGAAAESALARIPDIVPPTEFRDPFVEQIRDAYRPENTVAGAYTELIASLGAPFDLIIVDPQMPELRRRARPWIRRELERVGEHERALAAQTARLEEAGYPAQITLIDGASNVFYEDDQARRRLVWDGAAWDLRGSDRRLTLEQLLAELEEEPDRFSANVALRPVLESALLPTVSYVAGPGELSYFAQLGCLFDAHGVDMPVVYPRFSVTLVEAKVSKVLEKFDLDLEAFDQPAHELKARVVEGEVPESVSEALSALRRSIQQGYQKLYEAAEAIDPTLKGPIFGARNTAFQELAETEKKIEQHLKQQNEIGLEQLDKAAHNLRPANKPQERVVSPYQYLMRYGEGLVPALLDAMEVRLDGASPGWTGVRCAGDGSGAG